MLLGPSVILMSDHPVSRRAVALRHAYSCAPNVRSNPPSCSSSMRLYAVWKPNCAAISAHRLFVIRYDTRTPHPPVTHRRPGYSLTNLAADALGLLDVLGVGGHLVCRRCRRHRLIIGVDHPDRAASLTFVTTSTADPGLPSPSAGSRPIPAPRPADPAAVADFLTAQMNAYSALAPLRRGRRARAGSARRGPPRDIAATLVNHYAMDIDGRSAAASPTSPRPPWWCTAISIRFSRSRTAGAARRDPRRPLLILRRGHDVPRPLWIRSWPRWPGTPGRRP